MQRVLSYFSRPYVFTLTILLLLGLAAATWSVDQFLDRRTFNDANVGNNNAHSAAARITQRGHLVIGVRNNVAPFGFTDEDGNLQGFDVDIANEIARRWLGENGSIELTVVNAADRIPLLVGNEIDLLIAAMPNRRDRDALIDFSRTYFEDNLGLLVRANSEIADFSGLRERTVAVLSGSAASETLTRESSRQEISLNITDFSDYPQALDSLGAGNVDAIAANSIALIQMAQGNPGLRVVNTAWDRQPYSIGIPQGDSRIRAMVNFTLEDMKQDGTYDALYQKWFASTTPYDFGASPGEWAQSLEQLAQAAPREEHDLLQGIRERGYLIAGVPNDVFPFGFQEGDDEWAGFDIDLVRELARRWLGDESAIELVPGEIFEHVNSLAGGELDLVAAGMIMRREWATTIDFSQSYIGPPVVNEPLGIALPQDAPAFRELVNFTLQEMKKDGLYDTLHVRWFGSELPVYGLETWPGKADYLLSAYYDQETPVRITAPRESTIKRIRQRGGILRVGIAEQAYPFGFRDEFGALTGFDVDLAAALADEWGLELDLVGQKRSEQMTQLLQGEVDLLGAGLVHTKQRESEIDFSQTYFINGQNILIRHDGPIDEAVAIGRSGLARASADVTAAEAKALADLELAKLSGTQIGVIGSRAASDGAQAYLDANGVAAEFTIHDSLDVALEQLRLGDLDAIISDNVRLDQVVKANSDFRRLAEPFTQEPYALGLAPGDSYFQNLINDGLQNIKRNGVYDSLHQKWFGTEVRPFAVELLPGAWPYDFTESPTALAKPNRSIVDRLANASTEGRTQDSAWEGNSAGESNSAGEGNSAEEGQEPLRLTVGINPDARPFSYIEEDGRPAGLDIELAKNLAARWLGESAAVDFVPVTTDDVGVALSDGLVDLVVGGFTRTQARQEDVDYSQTYYRSDHVLVVPSAILDEVTAAEAINADISASEDGPVTDLSLPVLKALNGKTIAVIDDSSTIEYLQDLANEHQLTLNLLAFKGSSQAIDAVVNGIASGAAGAQPVLESQIADKDDLILLDDVLALEPYALGLPIYDERFRDLVNFSLQEMQADGTLDRLVKRWLGDEHRSVVEIWPGDSYFQPDLAPMAYIPEGQFVRGNADGFPDERIERIVVLDGYYMDQYEVTNRHYDRCVRAGLCETPRLPRSINFSRYFAESAFGNYPVLWVSWDDAAEYCDFVGKRLPTEAEWERAARGPKNGVYPWGEAIPFDQSNFDYIRRDVAPVGAFAQDFSGFGVYDMAGNVREWVSDWYEWDYYQNAPQANPTGPEDGVTKVLRGGSWNDTAVYVRGTVRRNFLPDSVDANLGFRCASSKPPLAR